MTDRRFETISHTADKGIRAFGRDLNQLFENAAYGMFSLMADLEKYEASVVAEIDVEAADLEELLRGWLAELVFRFEVDRLLFLEFKIDEISDGHVRGTAKAMPFSRDIEWLGAVVKAVTHHDLSVSQNDDGWEATVIFDV